VLEAVPLQPHGNRAAGRVLARARARPARHEAGFPALGEARLRPAGFLPSLGTPARGYKAP
jgi:hypothetical protein